MEEVVSYTETVGGARRVTRQVFESSGRILGSEMVRETRWNGYAGWGWNALPDGSFQFASHEQAAAWLAEIAPASGAMEALERARAAWERSYPQLSLEV